MLFNPHKVLRIHKLLQHIPLNRIFDYPYQKALSATNKVVNIADLRALAKRRAHPMIFDYLDGGADDEITLRRNQDAYKEYEMHYQVLAGIQPTQLDMSTTLFGSKLDIPFFNSPTAGNRMFHMEGEEAVAKAAVKFGTMYSMSSLSTTSMSQITQLIDKTAAASAATEEKNNQKATTTTTTTTIIPKLFQLYVWKDRGLVKDLLTEARLQNFNCLALTVDASWMGNRERDIRNGFSIPPNYSLQQAWGAITKPAWTYDFVSHEPYKYACFNRDVPAESLVSFINQQMSPDFNWNDAEWLLGEWHTSHTALKGVIRPDDAVLAQQIGFATIWISNHGGRQMETAPATINVIQEIKHAINRDSDNRMSIIIDGGIQRGTDIAKAIALGANGVGIGKAYLWGLTAGGTSGVIKAYDILKTELNRAMGLLGVSTIEELRTLGPKLTQQRPPSIRDYPDRYANERGYGGGII